MIDTDRMLTMSLASLGPPERGESNTIVTPMLQMEKLRHRAQTWPREACVQRSCSCYELAVLGTGV